MIPSSKKMVCFLTVMLLLSAVPFATIGGAAGYGKNTNLNAVDASFLGEVTNNNAGKVTSCSGDLNGDGFDDIVIGVQYNDEEDIDAGQTYIFFGKPTGWAKGVSLSNADASFHGEFAGDYSGATAKIIGDVNGDDFDDLLIGAPFASPSGLTNAGKVYLIFGKASGWTMDANLGTAANASFTGESDLDNAGFASSGAGDVNGDGLQDIIIGAYGNDDGGGESGKIYILFGKTTGWAKDVDLGNADSSLLGESPNDWFGYSVAGVGDVNGDRFDDIIAGSPYSAKGAPNAGLTSLFLGKATGWPKNVDADTVDSASFVGEANGDQSGIAVAAAGDVNGDGLDDMLIGADANDQGFNLAGQIYVVFGNKTIWAPITNLNKAEASYYGEAANNFLGTFFHGMGDVNGDGFDDFMMGTNRNSEFGSMSGKAYLVLGNSSGWALHSPVSGVPISFHGEAINDNAGYGIGGMGDVNGDGFDDMMVGALGNSQTLPGAGKVYLIFYGLNAKPKAITTVKTYADPAYAFETHFAMRWDKVFVELRGTDGNKSSADIALVNVTSDSSPLGFQLRLKETGLTTGVYRGNFTVANMTRGAYRWIEAGLGEMVNVSSFDNASVYSTVKIGAIGLSPELDTVNATEDILYDSHYTGLNVTTAVWGFDTNASWLGFNQTTQNITGTPNNTNIQSYWVSLNITDGYGRAAARKFNVTVKNVAPDIVPASLPNATEGMFYDVDLNSTDDGQGVITWSMVTNAGAWLKLNATNGILNGTPANVDVGAHWVNVTVNDGNGGVTSANLTLNVINVDQPPVITTTDVNSTLEDKVYTVQYNVSDPDVDDIHTWTLMTDATWLYLGQFSGALTGIPTNDDVGSYWVNVSVEDEGGLSDHHNFTLTVLNVNDPPEWVSVPGPAEITEKDTYKFNVSAKDIDKGDKLTYGLVTTPTTKAVIDSTTGHLSWTTNVTAGEYVINVSASDGKVTIHHAFTLTVDHVNTPPTATLSLPAKGSTSPIARPTLQWTVADADGDLVMVDLYMSTDKSSVEKLDAKTIMASGIENISFTPTVDLVPGSTYYWTVIPFDGTSLGTCTNGPFDLQISTTAPINHAPTIGTIGSQKVVAGQTLEVTVQASDPDVGDVLTYSLVNPPTNMTISSTGKITWKPTKEQAGNYIISIKVSDGKLNKTTSFSLKVDKAPEKKKTSMDNGLLLVVVIAIVVLLCVFGALLIRSSSDEKEEETGEEKDDEEPSTEEE